MYFDRSVSERLCGNLSVSVNLSLAEKSFGITILDKRTYREIYYALPFHKSASFIESDIPVEQMLQTVNEGTVLGNVDEILRSLSISPWTPGTNDNSVTGEGSVGPKAPFDFDIFLQPLTEKWDINALADVGDKGIMIGGLLKYTPKGKEKRRNVIKGGVPERRIDIRVFSASNLTKLGNVAQRNAYCSIKWNMRAVGKSEVAVMTTEPEWSDANFTMSTRKGQPIEKCVLEVEVYDSDNEVKKGDFLGSVLITGKDLIDFLNEEQKNLFALGRCNRLPDHEQRFVQGSLLVCGQIDAKKPGYYKYEAEEKKAKGFGFGFGRKKDKKKKEKGFLGGGWGWGGNKKAEEEEEEEEEEENKEEEEEEGQPDEAALEAEREREAQAAKEAAEIASADLAAAELAAAKLAEENKKEKLLDG
jgi:hypothetical protein